MYSCLSTEPACLPLPGEIVNEGISDEAKRRSFAFLYGANTTTAEADIEDMPTKLRGMLASTAGTDGLSTYVGFSHGDEPASAIWSDANLARLRALKSEYDPQGLFSWYHPIPLE